MTLTREQQVLLKKLGDYFNNGYLSLDGVLQYIYDFSASLESNDVESNEYSSTLDEALSYVYYFSGLYTSDENNEKETRNSLLQSIIDGTYTPGSCTIDGCTDSVTSQSTSDRAEKMLEDVDRTGFGIANIPINDGSDNYDIFFKGKEVLEYKANLNGLGSSLLNNQIHPIFKNLFDNEEYNSHIINGTQLYHARKKGRWIDTDKSTKTWNSDKVYKIFSNCNFKIESISSIRYQDTNNDTNNDTTRVENLTNDSVDVFDVSS